MAEHMTFNHGVRSSTLRWVTKSLRTRPRMRRLNYLIYLHRDVAQLVARLVWDQDVAGSNPVIPTKNQPKASLFRLVFG